MKHLFKVSALLLTLLPIHVHANYKETSILFYGSYSDDYVMRWHFQSICQHSFDPRTSKFLWPTSSKGATFDPCDVKTGDLVFVRDVGTYLKTVHPGIKNPYIMITAGEYRDAVQEEFIDYLDDPKIIAWFSVHACEMPS